MIKEKFIKKIAKFTVVGALALSLTLTSTGIASADKGHCTDSHSKEWCDSHGYENNRPVAPMVKLTKAQEKCFWTAVSSGIILVKDCVITPNYIAVPGHVMSIIAACS